MGQTPDGRAGATLHAAHNKQISTIYYDIIKITQGYLGLPDSSTVLVDDQIVVSKGICPLTGLTAVMRECDVDAIRDPSAVV